MINFKVFTAFFPTTFVVSQVFWDSQVLSSQVLFPEGLAEKKGAGHLESGAQGSGAIFLRGSCQLSQRYVLVPVNHYLTTLKIFWFYKYLFILRGKDYDSFNYNRYRMEPSPVVTVHRLHL